MRFRYVTSMSKTQFDIFGKDMLLGLMKYWPEGEIQCYSEDQLPEVPGVKMCSLWDVPGATIFVNTCAQLPAFRGEFNGQRNYRYDIFNFSKKVFAQCAAASDFPGYLFWVDADVRTHNYIPAAKLEDWMLGNFMILMKRKTWHMCSSFVGWDCAHRFASEFWQHYYSLYMSGMVFMLREWHDAFVLESCIHDTPGARDIAASYTGDGPYNVFDMVFQGYACHLKGNLKVAQRYQQLIDIVSAVKPKHVIEVGTWNGKRAVQMHKASPEMKYFGFDLFEEATKTTDEEEKNVKPHHSLDDVSKRLKEAGMHFKLYRGDSKQTFRRYFSENGFNKADLIYIDGGHSVETIRSDFENSRRAIKKGGLIVMDDYYSNMPAEELEKVGAQAVLKNIPHSILPTEDFVTGGGKVQMAVVQC